MSSRLYVVAAQLGREDAARFHLKPAVVGLGASLGQFGPADDAALLD